MPKIGLLRPGRQCGFTGLALEPTDLLVKSMDLEVPLFNKIPTRLLVELAIGASAKLRTEAHQKRGKCKAYANPASTQNTTGIRRGPKSR